MSSPWKAKADEICAKVMKENEELTEEEFKKALSKEYPFGPRQGHPYKMWLARVKVFCVYRAQVKAGWRS